MDLIREPEYPSPSEQLFVANFEANGRFLPLPSQRKSQTDLIERARHEVDRGIEVSEQESKALDPRLVKAKKILDALFL